jgi:transcriptional regulator with XRE-family HTH domain
MTHFQRVFIHNLRYLRNQRELSQIKLSELVNISPNYLNAVENGKNFPSPEVIQRIIKVLGILPYQLFLERPSGPKMTNHDEKSILNQEITYLKQQLNREFDRVIQKYKHSK